MTEAVSTQKETWIEPEIRTLDVAETAGFPNRGRDGGRFVDCTRS
jgi:hypothetical protein